MLGPKMLEEMEQTVKKFFQILKNTQDKKKYFVDLKATYR